MDAAQLLGSPLARREDWATAYADAYGATPLLMPPDTTHLVLAADLNFEFFEPHWEVVVLEVSQPRTAESLAAQTGGTVDVIAGKPAVATPFDAYLVQIAPLQYGIYGRPSGSRCARWVRQPGESRATSLSPYLQQLVPRVQTGQAAPGACHRPRSYCVGAHCQR